MINSVDNKNINLFSFQDPKEILKKQLLSEVPKKVWNMMVGREFKWSPIFEYLVESAENDKRFEEITVLAEDAIKTEKDPIERKKIYYLLAYAFFKLKEFDRAKTNVTETLNIKVYEKPDNASLHEHSLRLYVNILIHEEEIFKTVEKAELIFTNPSVCNFVKALICGDMFDMYCRMGDVEKAFAMAFLAGTLDPEYVRSLKNFEEDFFRISVKYLTKNEYEQVLKKALVTKFPKESENFFEIFTFKAKAYLELAKIYMENKKLPQAVMLLRKGCELRPESKALRANLKNATERMKEQAIEERNKKSNNDGVITEEIERWVSNRVSAPQSQTNTGNLDVSKLPKPNFPSSPKKRTFSQSTTKNTPSNSPHKTPPSSPKKKQKKS